MRLDEVMAYHPGKLIPWEQHRIEVLCWNGEVYLGRFVFIANEESEHPALVLDQPEQEIIRTIWIEEILSITRVIS